MLFESKTSRVIPRTAYHMRLARQLGLVSVATALSLIVGVLGYHYTESMSWLDALLNASMILGGMGPVDVLQTPAGKWFASAYALYSGFFLILCGGLLLAPVFHRILHHFHADK